jgi:hypothetical protein
MPRFYKEKRHEHDRGKTAASSEASPQAAQTPNLPLPSNEKQAHECAQGGVDHVRYLLRLAELELIERERANRRSW